jgi:hypothetical protein
MRLRVRDLVLFTVGLSVLFSVPIYLLVAERPSSESAPFHVLSNYLKAAYARDYRQAYRFISARDRRLKTEKAYVRERGAFSGFTLELGRKLSQFIEARPVKMDFNEDHGRIKIDVKLPDANSLSTLVLNWDEEQLNVLPKTEQKRILSSLDQLRRQNRLTMVQGEEEFTMVKENGTWRVYLDWDAGVHVSFDVRVPPEVGIEARPSVKETVVRSGELFNVSYRVKNRTTKELYARIVHRIEPQSLAQHLELVQCALLLPVRILPGEETEYASSYLLKGDLPEDTRELKVTYEFAVED